MNRRLAALGGRSASPIKGRAEQMATRGHVGGAQRRRGPGSKSPTRRLAPIEPQPSPIGAPAAARSPKGAASPTRATHNAHFSGPSTFSPMVKPKAPPSAFFGEPARGAQQGGDGGEASGGASGVGSLTWLRRELKRRGVAEGKLLPEMDTHKSDKIFTAGFTRGLQAAHIHLTPEQYAALFKAVDTDGSRHVSRHELLEFLYPDKVIKSLTAQKGNIVEDRVRRKRDKKSARAHLTKALLAVPDPTRAMPASPSPSERNQGPFHTTLPNPTQPCPAPAPLLRAGAGQARATRARARARARRAARGRASRVAAQRAAQGARERGPVAAGDGCGQGQPDHGDGVRARYARGGGEAGRGELPTLGLGG